VIAARTPLKINSGGIQPTEWLHGLELKREHRINVRVEAMVGIGIVVGEANRESSPLRPRQGTLKVILVAHSVNQHTLAFVEVPTASGNAPRVWTLQYTEVILRLLECEQGYAWWRPTEPSISSLLLTVLWGTRKRVSPFHEQERARILLHQMNGGLQG
jgi:hypothetical protein